MSEIKLKLAYEPPSEEDGTRILVDRLWPCGKTKASLELHFWAKAISPSNELRKTFGHMAEWFEEFTVAYQAELYANPTSAVFIDEIMQALKTNNVTLVFAARDEANNHAQVPKSWLEKILKTQRGAL